MRNLILLWGTDPALLSTRRDVLRRVGYEAQTVSGTEEIESTLRSRTTGALVLCHTLTSDQQAAALKVLHRHSPETKSILMNKSTSRETNAIPDAFVFTGGGPKALVQTLEGVLGDHCVETGPTFVLSEGVHLLPSHG